MDPALTETLYSTRIEEALWGALLVAITLAMHGFGMLVVVRATNALKARFERRQTFSVGMAVIILASWMIIIVHLMEVTVWARFFYWKNAVAAPNNNISLCYYFALMDYTTLGSSYNLKLLWRLLEGMIAIAGLLTFAWSTGVLLTLAQEFQDQQLKVLQKRRQHRTGSATDSRRPPGEPPTGATPP